MHLTYNIDNKLRFIVIYQDITKTPTQIAKHIGIHLSTIHNWIKKIESGQDILEIQEGREENLLLIKVLQLILSERAKYPQKNLQ